MLITIRLKKSVKNIPELSRSVDALEVVDEIYRLMKSSNVVTRDEKIDFRTKKLRDIKGGELETFRINSPIEISINADNLWIAALLYVLKDYSKTKNNIIEATKDLSLISKLIKNISEEEYKKIEIGLKLFSEDISNTSERNMIWLTKKLNAAKHNLQNNISSIDTKDE